MNVTTNTKGYKSIYAYSEFDSNNAFLKSWDNKRAGKLCDAQKNIFGRFNG